MKKRIISILHHSIKSPVPNKIAEELGWGWHFKTAKALAKYGGFQAIAMRPSGLRKFIIGQVNNVTVILTPTVKLSISNKLWKWSEISPIMAYIAKKLVNKYDYIPYIHEYRTLNSELVIRELIDYPLVLQHHGSYPPKYSDVSRSPKDIAGYVKSLHRDIFLRKVNGVIFVLNRHEKEYLENLGVDAIIKVRPMAVDFSSLRPISDEEKNELRRKYGINEDSVVLFTYVGIFREEFSIVKGAHLIPKIWKVLKKKYREIELIVTGLGISWTELFRYLGIKAFGYLPCQQYIELLKTSDILFLPATSHYYYGGLGVAIMEALALGKPIVSPTLIHVSKLKDAKYLGSLTPFIDNEFKLKMFIKHLMYVIESLESFNSYLIRQIAYKYFSWEVFTKEFLECISKFH